VGGSLAGCGSDVAQSSERDEREWVTLADGRSGERIASGNIRLDTGEVVDDQGQLVPDENPATVERLCQAMRDADCSRGLEYELCIDWFGYSMNSAECAGEVHILLTCVDMDVRFECDYNGVPFPRGVVEDPETAVLDEYCEEEWFTALDCVGAENSMR
jgi:hypothetical protein